MAEPTHADLYVSAERPPLGVPLWPARTTGGAESVTLARVEVADSLVHWYCCSGTAHADLQVGDQVAVLVAYADVSDAARRHLAQHQDNPDGPAPWGRCRVAVTDWPYQCVAKDEHPDHQVITCRQHWVWWHVPAGRL